MLSRFIAVAMILLSSQTIAQGRASGQIEWLVGDLPPFAWKEANKPRGYGVDLIAAMAGRMGRSVDISPVPWARAVATTREEITTACYRWRVPPIVKTNFAG